MAVTGRGHRGPPWEEWGWSLPPDRTPGLLGCVLTGVCPLTGPHCPPEGLGQHVAWAQVRPWTRQGYGTTGPGGRGAGGSVQIPWLTISPACIF